MSSFFTFLALLSALHLTNTNAFAEESCAPHNLYEDPLNPINAIPIWDQAHFGTCYAYGASQLVDYQLKSDGDPLKGEPVSPIWTAFNHKFHTSWFHKFITFHDPDGLEYSSIKWAIDDLKDYGVCKYATVKASIDAFKTDQSLSDDEFILLFSKLFKAHFKTDDLGEILEIMHNDKDLVQMISEYSMRVRRRHESKRKDKFLKSYIESLRTKIYSKAESKEYLSFLDEVLFKSCKGDQVVKITLPPLTHLGQIYASDQKIKRNIEQVLNDLIHPRPVAIGYCGAVYKSEELSLQHERIKLLPRTIAYLR